MSYRKSRHSLDRGGLDSDSEWNSGARTPPGRPSPPSRSDSYEPHQSKFIKPQQREFESDPRKTLFIGRLHSDTTEDSLRKYFDRFGEIESLFLIRDIITGDSRRYAFCEYRRSKDADAAYAEAHNIVIDGRRILVDREFGRTMKGWKPRRLGGGYNGGQLRFGRLGDRESFQPMRSSFNNNNNFNQNGSGYNSRGVGHFRGGSHPYQNSSTTYHRRTGFDDSLRTRMHGSNSGGYGHGYRRPLEDRSSGRR